MYFDNLQIIKQRANVLARMDYYPFGLQWANSDPDETACKYGHTSKEMQDREWSSTEGLDWEDFGARMYDPVVGRWWSVDPLAHSFSNVSPYASMFNNPISFIDPTGMAPEWHWEGNELVSDQGDDINTLNAFLGSFYNATIDWNKDNWNKDNWNSQLGSTSGMPHIYELYNIYKSKGGLDQQLSAGQVSIMRNEIEGFMGTLDGNFGTQNSGEGNWDINKDGKLQKEEADAWYITGGGRTINVNNSNIDWTGLTIPANTLIGGVFAISTTSAFKSLPYETASTYGGTSFRLIGSNLVEVFDQPYHYRMRSANSIENTLRNLATKIGEPAGNGQEFMINYYNIAIRIK